jgi:hypothetical protein
LTVEYKRRRAVSSGIAQRDGSTLQVQRQNRSRHFGATAARWFAWVYFDKSKFSSGISLAGGGGLIVNK